MGCYSVTALRSFYLREYGIVQLNSQTEHWKSSQETITFSTAILQKPELCSVIQLLTVLRMIVADFIKRYGSFIRRYHSPAFLNLSGRRSHESHIYLLNFITFLSLSLLYVLIKS